jgi:hypothetical protein
VKRVLFFAAAAAAILSAGIAAASEHEDERYEYGSAEFYGVIDALPQNGIDGIWQVNGRQVVVSRRTEIKEKRGRVAVGAYIKVEGYPSGSTFAAEEIEVKGHRR